MRIRPTDAAVRWTGQKFHRCLSIEVLESRQMLTVAAPIEFLNATFFGGPGDQSGTDVAIHGEHLYLSGRSEVTERSSLALSYELPTSDANHLTLRWQTAWPPGLHSPSEESFEAVIPSDTGVYFAGASARQTSDGVGGTESKSIVVQFTTGGPNGSDVGGADWVSRPHFFPYRGYESMSDGLLMEDSNGRALYVVGSGEETGFGGWRALISKIDPRDGSVVWKRKYASDPSGNVIAGTRQRIGAHANSVVELGGYLYVAGFDRYATPVGGTAAQGMLLKLDPAGESPDPNPNSDGAAILNPTWVRHTGFNAFFSGVAVLDDSLYVAGHSFTVGKPNASDFVIQKYDDSGTLLWNRQFGGEEADQLTDIIAVGHRLLAVGFTESEGAGGQDVVIMEIDPETGETVQTELYGGPLNDRAYAVAAYRNTIFVVGESRSVAHGSNALGESDLLVLQYRLDQCALPSSVMIHDGDLVVCGTPDADRISFATTNSGGIRVRLNDQSFGPFDINGSIIAFAGAGDDQLSVASTTRPVEFHGEEGNDYLAGGLADDILVGGPGNDRIHGGEGNNYLSGGDGDDRLTAKSGDDVILGGAGNDRLLGGDGSNFLDGGEGDDLLSGGLHDDVLIGGTGDDTLSGYFGNNVLVGGEGHDELIAEDGHDMLFAGAGRDYLRSGAGNDLLVANRSQFDGLAASDFEQVTQVDATLRAVLFDWQLNSFDPDFVLGADEDDDDLFGELGADWFFAHDEDRVRDFQELQGDRSS